MVVLESLVTLILVLVAITGISYHAFRDGGWVAQGFGKISDAYINYPLMAAAVTFATIWGIRSWHNRKLRGARHKYYDYLIYALMAVGIYFIGHYIIRGEL